MLMHHDPDEWETVSEHRTCGFHEDNPGKPYAGCTCSASTELRRRSWEDIAAIKAERRRKEEDGILARAEFIKWQRGEQKP